MKTIRAVRLRRKFLTKANAGFTLVEVLVSSAILATSLLALSGFNNSVLNLDRSLKTRNNILQVKSGIISTLSNQKSWLATVDASGEKTSSDPSKKINPELACIRNSQPCQTGDHPLTILDQNGDTFLDADNQHAGFTRDGVACNAYGNTDPSNTCLYKLNVTWSPICPATGSCIRPQVSIRIQLESTDTTPGAVSTLQAQMNMQMMMLVPQILGGSPVVKRVSTYTNSTLFYEADSPIIIQPLSAVASSNPIQIVSFATKTSQAGGTVTFLNSKQMRYEPMAGYYGVDFFTYTVRDIITQRTTRGTVAIRVMTPFTWTGLAGGGDLNSSNQKNFCGKVVNGICDSETFPGGPSGGDVHIVFNNTCTNCNSFLNYGFYGSSSNGFVANSLEMANTYSGTVRLDSNGTFANSRGTWKKPVNVLIEGGTLDASRSNRVNILASDRGWGYKPPVQEDYALKIQGQGSLISPRDLAVEGAFFAQGSHNFSHYDGNVYLFGIWDRNSLIYAPGVEFYNLNFGSNSSTMNYGSHTGYQISSDLIVTNTAGIFPDGGSDDIANGPDVNSWTYSPTPPKITVAQDLLLQGKGGGAHCDGGAPNSCLGPIFEMAGTGDQNIFGPVLTGDISIANLGEISTAPSIHIRKPSGNLVMAGPIAIRKEFRVHQIADYDFMDSQLIFNNTSCGESVFSSGPATEYNDFYEMMSSCTGRLNLLSSQFNVRGNYYHLSSNSSHVYGDSLKSAKVNLYGNFVIDGNHDHDHLNRAAVVEFVGTGNQHIVRASSSDSSVSTMHWHVNKPSGTLFLDGRVGTMADLIVLSGNLQASPGSTFYTRAHGTNSYKTVLNAPGTVFENIEVGHALELASNISTQNLKIGSSNSFSGLKTLTFNLSVLKNLTMVKDFGTTNKILLAGNQNQDFTFESSGTESTFRSYEIDINKSGGTVNFTGSGRLEKVCVRTPAFVMNSSSYLHSDYFAADAANFNKNGATLVATLGPYSGCPAGAP